MNKLEGVAFNEVMHHIRRCFPYFTKHTRFHFEMKTGSTFIGSIVQWTDNFVAVNRDPDGNEIISIIAFDGIAMITPVTEED